jgi:hypothetical protein
MSNPIFWSNLDWFSPKRIYFNISIYRISNLVFKCPMDTSIGFIGIKLETDSS